MYVIRVFDNRVISAQTYPRDNNPWLGSLLTKEDADFAHIYLTEELMILYR